VNSGKADRCLARGIDTAAHTGSLDTGTIAVVAGGLDIIYPPENAALYERIKNEGVIVAESPLSMEPLARHFPKRNRLISGLSSGVVVVEASLKSGSLITARMAAEQGRDVYAVPGFPLDPRAEGPNKLIQDGATLVRNAHDILQNLNQFTGGKALQDSARFDWIDTSGDEPPADLETARVKILENLSQTPVAVDELIRACQLSVSAVQMALLELELGGRVQRLPGNRVVLLSN
jgi:DNA processing protein